MSLPLPVSLPRLANPFIRKDGASEFPVLPPFLAAPVKLIPQKIH